MKQSTYYEECSTFMNSSKKHFQIVTLTSWIRCFQIPKYREHSISTVCQNNLTNNTYYSYRLFSVYVHINQNFKSTQIFLVRFIFWISTVVLNSEVKWRRGFSAERFTNNWISPLHHLSSTSTVCHSFWSKTARSVFLHCGRYLMFQSL